MAVDAVVSFTSTMGLPTVASDCWTDDDWNDRRGVGLHNLGNTCYQNAILQCLLHNKAFVSLLNEEDIEEDSIAHHFLQLWRSHLSRAENVIRAEGIRDAMAKRHPWLGDGRQHDAQEFLVLLLDQLHDQLKRVDHKRLKVCDEQEMAAREWNRFLQLNGSSVVSDTFQGQLCSTVTCVHCQRTSCAFEPFMYLCVPVPVSLETTVSVVWSPIEGQKTTHEITVDNKYRPIRVIKDKLRQLSITEAKDEDLLLAEVDGFHVRRLLEDTEDLVSVVSPLHCFQLNAVSSREWHQNCPICLEALPSSELLSHSALCSSAVCASCLSQLEFYGHETPHSAEKSFSCHSCAQHVSRADFTLTAQR